MSRFLWFTVYIHTYIHTSRVSCSYVGWHFCPTVWCV